MLRRVMLAAGLLLLLYLAYILVVLQPSNQRDWEFGMATLEIRSGEVEVVTDGLPTVVGV